MQKLLFWGILLGIVACRPISKTSPIVLNTLDSLATEHNYPTMSRMLDTIETKRLSPALAYLSALVANKEHNPNQSEAIIAKAYQQNADSLFRDVILPLSLLRYDNFTKNGQYAKAATTATVLLRFLATRIAPKELVRLQQELPLYRALYNVPPPECIKATQNNSLDLAVTPTGLWHASTAIGKYASDFVIDISSPYSAIGETTAQQLELPIKASSYFVKTPSGERIKANYTVAPNLALGTARFKNVVFLVLPDSSLFLHKQDNVKGILGYPILSAIEQLKIFTEKSSLESPVLAAEDSLSNLGIDGHSLYTYIHYGSDKLPVLLDFRARTSYFYANFYKKYASKITNNYPKDTIEIRENGFADTLSCYSISDISFIIGGQRVVLPRGGVLTETIQPNKERYFYGVIGQDVFAHFKEWDFNLKNSSLRLK